MGAHHGNSLVTVDELFEKYWKAACSTWQMPEFRCEPGRHRRQLIPGITLLSRARFAVPAALTAVALLAGCKPSGAAEAPPSPVTTGPTPSPLVVSVERDGAAFVAELLDARGGSAL